MGKRRTGNYKGSGEKKPESFFGQMGMWIANIYLILMLVVYPLFQVNGYMDLLYKKWALFLHLTAGMVLVSLLCYAPDRIGRLRHGEKPVWQPVDWFVLGYLLCVLISYIGAVDREAALWGVDTWYTGFVTQLLLVGIYFMVSRGYGKVRYLDVISAVAAVIVGGIVILQRFGVDVLHLYEGFGEDVKLEFVTTLGQVTWTSSYVSILLIAGMGIYFLTGERKRRIFWGICIGIGFAMEMVLNCDSGIIALAVAMMILAWKAMGNRERTLRMAEIVMAALVSIAVIGIGERLFGEHMIPIDEVYRKAAQSWLIYPVFAVIFLFYFLIIKEKIRIGENPGRTWLFRGIYLGLIGLGAGIAVVLFILHGKGYFAGRPTENYFRFTIWWGNSRGFIWRVGAAVFSDFNIWRKLFGCGPDCFTPYAYQLMGDAINEFWHNQIVPNVHNEWFNAMINYGILGGASYLGIFVSSAYICMKKAFSSLTEEKTRPVLFGCGLASAGYIAHNVLCYQQIIGAPVIFILIGIGAAGVRQGYGREKAGMP